VWNPSKLEVEKCSKTVTMATRSVEPSEEFKENRILASKTCHREKMAVFQKNLHPTSNAPSTSSEHTGPTTMTHSSILSISLILCLVLVPLATTAYTLNMVSESMKVKLKEASELFQNKFAEEEEPPTCIAVAPGRVNLIGEHVDYTGGFVLPFAIDYSTVVVGKGCIKTIPGSSSSSSSGPRATLRFVSGKSPEDVAEVTIDAKSTPPEKASWKTYVTGTVFQYLADLPSDAALELTFSISGDVPLGSGLSSSASLEVSVARFVETILGDAAFSSCSPEDHPAKIRALRCQKAENEWAKSPCGLMDQYISSAGQEGSLLLIDCTSLEYQETKMATTNEPVLVVANSNVQHDIGGGEYPVRVRQCQTATEALRKVNPRISTLRDATLEDVEAAKKGMDEISFLRAKHVVTENVRTLQAKEALEKGDWKLVGELMSASHTSMRDDYEVSCEEIDILVDIAQQQPGVYGSRLTGGGFGGCTVTLVDKAHASALVETLIKEYKAKTGKDCFCFETKAARGAHVLPIDTLKELS
jgi:galactokinase